MCLDQAAFGMQPHIFFFAATKRQNELQPMARLKGNDVIRDNDEDRSKWRVRMQAVMCKAKMHSPNLFIENVGSVA